MELNNRCLKCNKVTKIYAKKLCKSCYNKSVINMEKQKVYYQRWLDKNPDYYKDYYLIKRQEKISKYEN